jgi:hypothetical protein
MSMDRALRRVAERDVDKRDDCAEEQEGASEIDDAYPPLSFRGLGNEDVHESANRNSPEAAAVSHIELFPLMTPNV